MKRTSPSAPDGHAFTATRERLVFGTEVLWADWEAGPARWRLRTSGGEITADIVIAASGPLSEPNLPDVPGLADFAGEIFHSARWNHSCSLEGKRVAVVGTGASAIQIVPRIPNLCMIIGPNTPRGHYILNALRIDVAVAALPSRLGMPSISSTERSSE